MLRHHCYFGYKTIGCSTVLLYVEATTALRVAISLTALALATYSTYFILQNDKLELNVVCNCKLEELHGITHHIACTDECV